MASSYTNATSTNKKRNYELLSGKNAFLAPADLNNLTPLANAFEKDIAALQAKKAAEPETRDKRTLLPNILYAPNLLTQKLFLIFSKFSNVLSN